MKQTYLAPKPNSWLGNSLNGIVLDLEIKESSENTAFFRTTVCLASDLVYGVTPNLSRIDNNAISPYFENFYEIVYANRTIFDSSYPVFTQFIKQYDTQTENKVVDRLSKKVEALIEVGIIRPASDHLLTLVALNLLAYQMSYLVCNAFPYCNTLHTRVVIKDDSGEFVKENEWWFADKTIYVQKSAETEAKLVDIFVQHILLTYAHKFFASGEYPQCLHQSLPSQFDRQYILNEWYFKSMKSVSFKQASEVPKCPPGTITSKEFEQLCSTLSTIHGKPNKVVTIAQYTRTQEGEVSSASYYSKSKTNEVS